MKFEVTMTVHIERDHPAMGADSYVDEDVKFILHELLYEDTDMIVDQIEVERMV